MCPRCGVVEETLDNLCFKCPFSKHIWQGSRLVVDFDVGEELSVGEWLKNWLRRAPDEEAILDSIKLLWGIWLHRNKAVYDNVIEDPVKILYLMQNLDWTCLNFRLGSYQTKCADNQKLDNDCPLNNFIVTNNLFWCPDMCIDKILIDRTWYKDSYTARATWVGVDSKVTR